MLPQAPTVTVTPASSTAMVGQQIQLTATVTDAMGNPVTGTVTWAIGNPALATVSPNGLVMALAAGQVTVTATSAGGSGTAMITITAAIVVASVSAGTHHTCGVTTSGVGYCWGDNSSGQLGNGTTTNSTTPVPVSGGYSFAMISAGGSHTCGITSFVSGSRVGGTLYCWGDNTYGQLGNGMKIKCRTTRRSPTRSLNGKHFDFIAAGANFSASWSAAMTLIGTSVIHVD